MEGVVALAAELLHFLQALGHLLGHLGRVVDDDPVVALRRMAEGRPDEFMELLQVGFGAAGTGEDDREGQVLVVRVHEDAQQVEELLHGPGAAGKMMTPWPTRTKASRRFSMSGRITSSLTIGFGASAAMIPGSVRPR